MGLNNDFFSSDDAMILISIVIVGKSTIQIGNIVRDFLSHLKLHQATTIKGHRHRFTCSQCYATGNGFNPAIVNHRIT